MTDLVMRKRAARAGEIGLFVSAEVFEDDFASIKMDAEVQVKATTPRSLRQLKFAWALATKVADGCDWVETKEDAMDFMLIEAKHFRRIYDPLRNVAVLKPKPTNFGAMDGTEYTRLLKRIVWVATNVMIPGMNDAALKAEIEAMIGPDAAPSEPEPAKPPKAARNRKATPTSPDPQETTNPGSAAPAPPSNRKEDQATEGGGQEPARPGDAKPGPTNEAEYIAAARGWIAKQTDHNKALEYLDSAAQIELRAKCRLSVGANKMLRRELSEHLERNANAKG